MATTKEYRLGEFTYPRGRFMIAESTELDTYKPVAVRFFGKDFARMQIFNVFEERNVITH